MNTNSETQHPASLPLCVRVCAIDLPCCYHWHGYVVRTMTVCSDRDVAPLAYLLDLCVVPLPIPAVAMRACQCAAALALTPISSASGLGGKGSSRVAQARQTLCALLCSVLLFHPSPPAVRVRAQGRCSVCTLETGGGLGRRETASGVHGAVEGDNLRPRRAMLRKHLAEL